MKLLHTSDWHLGVSLHEFSLLEDQAHFLRWLTGLLEEEEVDVLLLAGDIYDRPIPPGEAIRLYDSFLGRVVTQLGIKVLAISGNHDSGARLGFAAGLLEASGYYIAGVPSARTTRVELADAHGPVHIHLQPWIFPADVRTLLPDSKARTFDAAYRDLMAHNLPHLDRSARNLMVAHGFFAGQGQEALSSDSEIQVGGMDMTGSDIFAPFDYVALGHLHAPQRAGGRQIRYSGSPLKYSLSEERQRKSVTLVELGPPGQTDIREIPVPALRDVRTVSGSFQELMEPSRHQNKCFEDYVFARIEGPGEYYAMEKLRTLFPNLLGLELVTEAPGEALSLQGGERRKQLTMEEAFRRFYGEVRGGELSREQAEILAEMISRAEKRGRDGAAPE